MRNTIVVLGIVTLLVIMGMGVGSAQYLQDGRWTMSYNIGQYNYATQSYNPITGWAHGAIYNYGINMNWYQGYVSPSWWW